MRHRAAQLLGSVVSMLVLVSAAFAGEPPASVEQGRKALGSSWNYPWYDGDEDTLRRLEVETPWQPASWKWNPGLGGGDYLLNAILIVVGLALLSILVYFLVQAYLRRETRSAGNLVAARRTGLSDQARVEALPVRLGRAATDLLGEARRQFEQGNFSEAILYLFSFQLIELDKGGWIRLAKGKTNRQYLREANRRREFRGLLEPTLVAFEDVFFGNHPLPRARFEACWSRLDEFLQLAQQEPA
jgi:uncharacterized protein DUF4129